MEEGVLTFTLKFLERLAFENARGRGAMQLLVCDRVDQGTEGRVGRRALQCVGAGCPDQRSHYRVGVQDRVGAVVSRTALRALGLHCWQVGQ